MAKTRAPIDLGTKAKRVWRETTEAYDLRADELRILEDACREVDLIERIENSLKKTGLVVKGSQGQVVASPLVQEIRQHRALLKSLLGSLKLPEEEGNQGSRSTSARDAAMQRWRLGS